MDPQIPSMRPLVLTLSAVNFVIGMGAFVVVALLEPISEGLAVSPVAAGQLMTIYALAYAVLSPLLVAATGRIGRRRVLFWGTAVFAVSAALAALAHTHGLLMASRVLAATGAGVVTPVGAAVVAALSPEASRGKMLAAVFFGLTLAQVLGVPVGAWIGYEIGWRWAFWIVAALALPCLWLIWTRVPRGLEFQPVTLADLGGVLRNGAMMLAIAFTGLFLGGIYVIYTYFALLMSQGMGFGPTQISLALFVFGVGAVIGNLFGGWLTDRIGAGRALAGLAVLQVLIMPVFAIQPMAAWAVFALCLVWAVFGWSFMPAQQARLVMRAPAQAPVSLSLNAAAIYVGAAGGAAIGGLALSSFGLGVLGLAGAAVTALSLLSLWLAR